jgi:hypothetical protein
MRSLVLRNSLPVLRQKLNEVRHFQNHLRSSLSIAVGTQRLVPLLSDTCGGPCVYKGDRANEPNVLITYAATITFLLSKQRTE